MNDYEKFLKLHQQKQPFILANAWNVKSAQIIEASGFEAIATSSGAISSSMGYEDNEKMPFSELLYLVQRIKSRTSLPLSVDFEKGYTNDLDILNENIQKLIDAGVAGINLEDSQGEDMYLKKLSGIKNYLDKHDLKLFINARTDAFIQKLDAPMETIIRRAKRYKDAGADGLFVPGIQDPAMIQQITSSTPLPVNIVGTPGLTSAKTMGEYGIKRISMAVFMYRSAYAHLEKIAKEVQDAQSVSALF
jgi:2-methylisocitrate lyase-like PEP mutase family enzyme